MKKTILFIVFVLSAMFNVNAQTTQISTAYCGRTATSTTEFIWADSIGTPSTQNNHRYMFKLQIGASTNWFTTNNEWPIFQWYLIGGSTYNTTYTASVAYSSDYGVTFGAFGPTCTVISPSFPSTSLTPASCGSAPNNFNTTINAEPVPFASQYEYKMVNASLGYTQSLIKTNQNFMLSQFTGLAYSTTYSVSARVKINTTWGSFSNVCQITTPPAPTTSLTPTYCNSTASSYTQIIYAESNVGDSVKYKLENSTASYTQTFTKTNFNFNLSQFTGLLPNTTYSVSAAIKYLGNWGPYGNVCGITTPASPTSSIVSAECGVTATSYTSQIFHTEPVTNFNCYFYNFTDGVTTYTLEKCNNNNFLLSQLTPTLPLGTTFTVTVKVKYNGIYGAFGNACTIATPATYMRIMNPTYPNPFMEATTFTVESELKSPVYVKVTDRMGRIVESQILEGKPSHDVILGKDLGAGIYNVILNQGSEVKTFKVSKN